MKIEVTFEEGGLILDALTLALTCVNDPDYLNLNGSDVRKILKKQVLVMDAKIKGAKK